MMEQAMMSQSFLNLVLYLLNFAVLFWGLQAVQWQYLFQKNSGSQILLVQTITAMGLSYISTQFLLALFYAGRTIVNTQL